MRFFLKKRIAFTLVFILILLALQMLLVFLSLDSGRPLPEMKHEIIVIMAVFFMIILSLIILFIAQIPHYMKKFLQIINNFLSEISEGSYQLEIDTDEFRETRDKEMVETLILLKKMLDIILRFDQLKKQKIQEQKARIIALLNLTENGFIIINRKGDIIYINHLIANHFPIIKENVNIIEANFSLEIDKNIKSYIVSILKNQSKLMPKNFFMSANKRHITLKSEIIRDNNGEFDGIVIGVFYLEKKRIEKEAEREKDKDQ